jgi:hypothetical protein
LQMGMVARELEAAAKRDDIVAMAHLTRELSIAHAGTMEALRSLANVSDPAFSQAANS